MHGKAELLAVKIMVKAGRKSTFIRVSGLFVAYGNDKRLFYPQKNNTADIPPGLSAVFYIAFMFLCN